MDDRAKALFDETEKKRLEVHQMGLKYIVAMSETGCVWIDHFLFLLCLHWYKSNGIVEAVRLAEFTKVAEVCIVVGVFARAYVCQVACHLAHILLAPTKRISLLFPASACTLPWAACIVVVHNHGLSSETGGKDGLRRLCITDESRQPHSR
jgi:hypothetical protein